MKQFFINCYTYHLCGGSIPLWIHLRWLEASFWTTDRLPWFLRKRMFNLLCGREVFDDFHSTDIVIRGSFVDHDWFLCMKW